MTPKIDTAGSTPIHPDGTRRASILKRFLRIVVVVAAVALAIYLGIGAYVATQMTKPVRQEQVATPADYGLAFEETSVRSRDGLALAGWFIPAAGSKRVVLLIHGRGQCRSCEDQGRFVELAARLQRAGYNVMMIDLRAHGQSAGTNYTMGVAERWDILGAVDWLHEQGFTQIAVLGVSLGAGSAAEAAADPDGGQGIKALILDSCYSNLPDLLNAKFTQITGLPTFFVPGSLLMARLLLHVDIGAINPAADIRKTSAPIFLIFGEKDTQVPRDEFEANEAARPDAETWLVPEIDHAAAYPTHPDEYVARVNDFLTKAMP